MKSLHSFIWWRSLRDRLQGDKIDEKGPKIHDVAGIKAVFPHLPAMRPYQLSISDLDKLTIQQSLFFQKLPFEIRLMVYTQLFGNRRLHIYFGPNKTKTKWEWRGFVCHRIQKMKNDKMVELGFEEDECIDGRYVMCGWLPDKSDCLIKALPWLQSCRQAYSEGIDILYSSNEFYLQTFDKITLFYNLPSLFLPQRLACIKRLELQTRVDGYSPEIKNPDTQLPEFDNLLQILCSSFPRLTRLSMSITSHSFDQRKISGGKAISIQEALVKAILSPMDNLVDQLSTQLQYCLFVIGESYYYKIKETQNLEEIGREIPPWRELKRTLTVENVIHTYWIQGSYDFHHPPPSFDPTSIRN